MIKLLTVCYNSACFVEKLCKSTMNTCGIPYTITVVDNGSNENDMHTLEILKQKYNINILNRQQSEIYAPSRHHGEAIHFGLDTMDSEDNIAIVDCDSVFIFKNWGLMIENLLKEYDHVTCMRPQTNDGCGAWFSAFKLENIRNEKISFLPMLNDDGSDQKRNDKYDVGSDLARMRNWKPLKAHNKLRYSKRGHLWMLDGKPFIDHMGACRREKDMKNWDKWLMNNWRIKL